MSNKPNYKTSRKYKCPYCDYKDIRSNLCDHVDRKHEDLLPEGYTSARAVYDSINGKNHGTCMVCKKEVYKWNDKINRYYNLCDDPKCRAKVRETALQRHMKVYNKPTLLNDADQQEKMLANRKISGTYTFTDGGKLTYTGSYEKSALEFMDKVLQIPSKDIQAPGPVLEYKYGGKTHKWITDIYYIPGNLLIEVKDGGSNPNKRTMTSYREKQVAKEEMVTNLGTFNYIRLTNNDFAQLLSVFADMKNEALSSDSPKATIHINEAAEIVNIPEIDKEYMEEVFNSMDRNDKKYYDSSSLCLDGVLWYKIEFKDSKPIGFILIRQRKNNPYCGFIAVCVDKQYRKRGIASKLVSEAINFGKNNLSTLTYNVIKGNDASNRVARKNKFKLYKSYPKYNEYHMDFRKRFNEEVGGLPVNRPPEAYVVPYTMGSVFDGFGYYDSDLGNVIVDNGDGTAIPIVESEFFHNAITGPVLYYKGSDIREKMNEIHEIINNNKVKSPVHLAEILCGYHLHKPDDIVLSESFRYYDINREKKLCSMIENGIKAKLMSGKEDIVSTVNENTYLHHTPNGYYVSNHPDSKVFVASEIYTDKDDKELGSTVEFINSLYDEKEEI